MKNITLSAHEEAIQKARHLAAQRNSTLNEMFRQWLDELSKQDVSDENVESHLDEIWKKTSYVRVGQKFTRDEMNER